MDSIHLHPIGFSNAAADNRLIEAVPLAAAMGADLVAFPELFLAGYPPEDLVLRPSFVASCRAAVEELAKDTVTVRP